MYPAPAVAALVNENFVPVRVHVKENPKAWHRFGIRWTPTVMVAGPDGTEVRRVEGFLPEDDLLGQLELGLGYFAANRKDWPTAERWFRAASERQGTEAAAEGTYWEGVAQYSASHDHTVLSKLRRRVEERHPDTIWAKRVTVWDR